MASMNIFERYGIKEVANVYFEALEGDQEFNAGDIVLYLDTLKVSTIETTAENVSAQGGWGNPKLVTWDYGKDINLTLEDAVISWEEMRILMGAKMKEAKNAGDIVIRKNAEHVFAKGASFAFPTGDGKTEKGENNFPTAEKTPTEYRWINLDDGTRGNQDSEPTLSSDKSTRIRFFWQEDAVEQGIEASELVISPDRYPGTYRVVGDALIRSEKSGSDEAFQFVINKAKMLSEVTLTMQAEGDPSTFNMTLNVLRDPDGNMMSLIKY